MYRQLCPSLSFSSRRAGYTADALISPWKLLYFFSLGRISGIASHASFTSYSICTEYRGS